ncbi:MAG TPA: hypothetical protein VJ767_07365 [Nitrososphaeraceae archaeon]|nr:hypothetical protein [Nitrososphaeraceae archaeon]
MINITVIAFNYEVPFFILLLAFLIVMCTYISYSYGQPATNEIGVCDNYDATKHWDKIIFKIINQQVANKIQQPFNTEMDIKVLDNPRQVSDIKKNILNFLGLSITSEHRAALEIIDVDYTILCIERKIVLRPDGDEDGDRLLNKWEQNGIDVNNDNKIDFILRDANPLHKDIYVEVDFMSLHEPQKRAIADVVDSFANSPVSNPDGINGINLHVDVDETISHQDTTNLANLVAIKSSNFGTLEEKLNIDRINILKAKQLVYHYGVFAHSQPGTSSSGVSNGFGAMEFLVTLGSPGWGTDPMTGHTVGSLDQQAGTFMHELGHNFNLRHGGYEHTNCKPNYLSVMSYTRQFSSYIGDRPLDYSRYLNFFNLFEGNLVESKGIGASIPLELRTVYGPSPIIGFGISGNPIDWNLDGDTLDTVRSDINNLDNCPPTPDQIYTGFDDWMKLVYISTPAGPFVSPTLINSSEVYSSLIQNTTNNIANQSIPTQELTIGNVTTLTPTKIANQSEIIEELTVEDIRQHRMELLRGISYTINSLPNTAFNQPQEAQKLKDSLILDPQNKTDSLANLLQSDKLDEAIIQLNELKAKMDSRLGGLAADDLITDPQAQQKVLPLIENLILVLEKQK